MPIQIPADLPARSALESENIFVMTDERAIRQDIRPLDIVIVNLMPTKIATETQLLRLLGNSPLQVNITLLRTAEHQSKNTPLQHLERFYKTFSEIRHRSFDGMIVTGAPVEHLPFEQVDYGPELCEVFEWSKTNVYSTFHICWGAHDLCQRACLFHALYLLGRPGRAVPLLRRAQVRTAGKTVGHLPPSGAASRLPSVPRL